MRAADGEQSRGAQDSTNRTGKATVGGSSSGRSHSDGGITRSTRILVNISCGRPPARCRPLDDTDWPVPPVSIKTANPQNAKTIRTPTVKV